MLKELFFALAVSVIVASPSFAMAKDGCGGSCITCHSLTQKEAADLLKFTGATVKSVKQAPVNGLFELLMEKDGKFGVLLVDYGKKHIIQGMMVSLSDLKQVSAHEKDMPQPKEVTQIDPATIPAEHAVTIGNPKGAKKLYVFTDPDCPYCRKMHVELKNLEKIAPDVAIHVMLYPLPMHPAAYDKSRTVVESRSRELLDKAFEGKEIPRPARESSKAAVDAVVKFASSNGISGTPTLVLGDGRVVVGMRDAETLKKMLDEK